MWSHVSDLLKIMVSVFKANYTRCAFILYWQSKGMFWNNYRKISYETRRDLAMTSVTSRVWRGCCCVCVERRSDEDDIRLSSLPQRSPWQRQRACITAGAACSPLSTAGAAGLYLFVNVSFFCIFNLYCIIVEIFDLIWIWIWFGFLGFDWDTLEGCS